MTNTLYVFPDTNLFLQCRPLDQLKWPAMDGIDAVVLVLTRPVQAEIDSLKGRGNGRQASRARTASTTIRQLLQTEDNRLSLRQGPPTVELWLNPSLRPVADESGVLNYEHPDDQLVGIATAFLRANNGALVRLLTNDTGPMASAKAVGLPFMDVPEDWLLPPEADESTKREARLKDELALYKSQEPTFAITFDHAEGQRFSVEVNRYLALTDDEVQTLMARLGDEYPLATDFGETKSCERMQPTGGGFSRLRPVKEVFMPATSADIEKYQQAHADWLSACEDTLRKLAKAMQRREVLPRVSLTVENSGSRPADDALAIFDAEGHFWLCPPKHKEDSDEPDKSDKALGLALDRPPAAPKGNWVKQHWSAVGSSMGSALQRMQALQNSPWDTDTLSVRQPYFPTPRDPNGVYFKVGSRGAPRDHIEYECAQWRHAQEAHGFIFDVWFAKEAGVYAGIIKVGVHAANLTQPATAQLPITITVKATSCWDQATTMVDALRSPSPTLRLGDLLKR